MLTKLTKQEAKEIQPAPPSIADALRDLKVGEALKIPKAEWPHASTPAQYIGASFRPERSDMTFFTKLEEEIYYIKRLT